jgi:glycerophosphoryl diester phosphodiesterase
VPGTSPEEPAEATKRPLVFGHRGSSYDLPEHTLGAYQRAITEGADGVECDVRLSRDGHLVCVHDRRVERTSNGRGLVRRLSLEELERLDFGSWHSARPAPLLTLETLLKTVCDAGRPLRVLIETKHPSRGGRALEPKLAAMLRRFGLDHPAPDNAPDMRISVAMMSFSPLALQRMRVHAPHVPRVFLIEVVPPGLRTGQLPYGARAAGPGIEVLRARPQLAHRLRERGHEVYVWTVNEPEDIDLCVRLGVTGIISDRPGYVRDRLLRRAGD